VALAHEEVSRVGCDRKGFALQAEERFVQAHGR
jgi:hypothetical protein